MVHCGNMHIMAKQCTSDTRFWHTIPGNKLLCGVLHLEKWWLFVFLIGCLIATHINTQPNGRTLMYQSRQVWMGPKRVLWLSMDIYIHRWTSAISHYVSKQRANRVLTLLILCMSRCYEKLSIPTVISSLENIKNNQPFRVNLKHAFCLCCKCTGNTAYYPPYNKSPYYKMYKGTQHRTHHTGFIWLIVG